MKRYCPTEDEEEAAFTQYCERRGLTHWHVPQETYTTSWKQKRHAKELGVRAGVSDHWVVIPTPLQPNGSLVVIEFKRQFGNTPSDDQIAFLESLYSVSNIAPACCYGRDEAVRMIEELEVGDFTIYDFCWERLQKIKKNREKRAKKKEKQKNECPF